MTPAAREAARIRQQRKYARDAARRVARAEAAARRLEAAAHAAEQLAPAAQREAVTDASGAVLRGPRVAIAGNRAFRALPTHKLTRPQIRALLRFRQDWDEVGTGVGVGVANLNSSHGHRTAWSAPPGQDALVRQLATRKRLEGAVEALGAFTGMAHRVLLDGIPVSAWAAETDTTIADAFGQLHAALNRLVAYYDTEPDRPHPRPEIRTTAPPRESYEV